VSFFQAFAAAEPAMLYNNTVPCYDDGNRVRISALLLRMFLPQNPEPSYA
jgi:hypothetical protein